MGRPYNFSAGPATIPEPVLQQAAAEMLDWHGSGVGVMEMSHRGKHFGEIVAQAESDLRQLLGISDAYAVLFMQGGALAQNALVPLNLSHGGRADYLVTGAWSDKSQREARKYCDVQVVADCRDADGRYTGAIDPARWQLRADARYLHYCANETIDGVEFDRTPDAHGVPLVADLSSSILSRPFDVDAHACIYAGAQKNIGPAGLTLVIVRRDLIGHALPACPSVFDYARQDADGSMVNTPPTWAIYIAGLVFQWLLQQREGALQGLAAMQLRNQRKADKLYAAIDASSLYRNPVALAWRSRMNVPFQLREPGLDQAFLDGANARGLLALKGHKSVGGMRASLYNAMPESGVDALIDYLHDFERSPGKAGR